MPFQAATEVLSFLKTCSFSPHWHPQMYQDACKKISGNHIDILLSILNCQGCYLEDRTSDNSLPLHEERRFGHVHQFCFELLQKLVMLQTLSDSLEESVVDRILLVENGAYMYNDQMLALLANILVCRVGLAGSSLRTKIYQMFVRFIHHKAKAVCSRSPSLKEIVETLPSMFHIEIVLIAFHSSSDEEKGVLANQILSSIKTIDIPSDGMQLSCWALLMSRLVLVLRHMIYHPRACPPLLLLDFRTKLREAAELRMPNSTNYLSSWPAIMLEDMMRSDEAPANMILLNQLIDIAPVPASMCREYPGGDCLGLNWEEVCASFSQILGQWNGRRAANVDDLIIERYVFVLCWDIPIEGFSSEHWQVLLNGPRVPDIINMKNFLYATHAILGQHATRDKYTGIPDLVLSLLQQLHGSLIPKEVGELGWDFLRSGSWLSFVLSLLCTGIQGCTDKNSPPIVSSNQPDCTAGDAEFLALTKSLVHSLSSDQVTMLLEVLSSLLKRYLSIYQRTLASIFEDGHHSADKLSPLLLLEYADLDNSTQDDLCEKMGVKPCLLGSLYELPLKLGKILEKFALGVRSKIFWEVILHGLPLHLQLTSEILSSCILNMRGIVISIGGLLEIKDSRGINWEEKTVISEILESILMIKCDKVFDSLEGKCEVICQKLKMGPEGLDYSSLFIMKRMEEFLRSICQGENVGKSIHECVVVKMVDIAKSLKDEPLTTAVFKFFLSMEDVSEKMKNCYISQRGDILVLIDALDYCHSESVNVRVLNFFTDLLSGDYAEVKLKLQMKFVSMDLVSLSKWLEMRLLGSVTETSNGDGAKGTSASLRDSTMNFITCLLTPTSGFQSEELQFHLHQAMLLSLENAFSLFDFITAKCYFNFVVQLSKGEMFIKPLLQRIVILIEKLAGNERLLQGLKFLFGFLTATLSECGSSARSVEKSSGKPVPSCSSGLGPLSSRTLGSRKNADDLVPSANRGSASVDCDATSVDDDEDDGTSDGELGSIDKDEEEDCNSERALASKVCTFTSSGSNFMEQHWYFCYTCDLTVSKGCCSVCAKVCHRGHRVVYSRSSRFFCDCGAGGVRGSSCQCLKPRKFTGSNSVPTRSAGNFQSFLSLTETGDHLPDSDSDVDEDASADLDNSARLSLPKEVQDKMPLLLDELEVESRILGVCSSLLPSITGRRDSNMLRDRKVALVEGKVLHYSNDLLQLKKAYKSGSLDLKIKADYSNAKELKSHLTSGSLVKSLLSLIGQATIAPVTADKANVKPLSKNVVRFEIVHLLFNSLVENYLVVAGYEDCQVLTINHRGEVIDRLAIELALQGAYIRRVEWVPGSQVQLMVVTNRFVKIYDLSQDNISPVHYITLPDDMIVDATLLVASHGRISHCPVRLSLKSNGILAISLGEHEVLAQSLRHTGGSTSPLVGVTAYRPLSKDKIHCLVLHEDGSLQIYSHIPAGVDTGVNLMADKITVSNSNPDIVMVGFRLHVGNTSASHIPSEITIFQRVIKLDEGMRSWYDIPFTIAESLLADEEFTISIGRTFSGSALPRIDSLEVYGRAKDEFGWKEKMDAILDMEARVLGCNSWSTGSGRKSRAAQSASVEEQVVADGLKLLPGSICCVDLKGSSKIEVEPNNLKCTQVLETNLKVIGSLCYRLLPAVFFRLCALEKRSITK
ncbi:UNVERIFIED_CONTAM: Auxin transport protein BIG [Sesamum radiatum]|uniref:Auxin transport protein BIG n=1 Tax=Sesamum radiatum TaxID=300843 RepID=A0AAW2RCY9_SESRA